MERATGRYSRPAKLLKYIERGWKTSAPLTEEEAIRWGVVIPLQKPDLFRKAFRVTNDLRDAYKELIRVCSPLYDVAYEDVIDQKLAQLYEDFYNFTALEWFITRPK